MSISEKLFGSFSDKELKRITPIQKSVLDKEREYAVLSDDALKNKTKEFKERLANGETLDDILPDAFAACREADWRVLGLKPYPVQILGGIALHKGRIAEMQTGEGKTLVATLPVYLNALTGNGVHVVTVNDYLATRDSEQMGQVYTWLGLTVGLITSEIKGGSRQEAYAADVTYGTNNEFGFDYLRDNMVGDKSRKVQRSHTFAIVDEVDSILIDEARTPLIISGKGGAPSELYARVNTFVLSLKKAVLAEIKSKVDTDAQTDGDYVVDETNKSCVLTRSGTEKAEKFFGVENLSDESNTELAHYIEKSIYAHGMMKKDSNYIVKDGEILIVDEFTGRLMVGRRYNDGLHQAIEAKEGVVVNSENKTMATITFQNYFRLYEKLSGMTGTAKTQEGEFSEIYGLNIVTVPTNKPNIRIDYPDTVYTTLDAKYNAVINQILECHEKGQPVLVGTVSVEKSEHLAKLLSAHTKNFSVLNAKYHQQEAEIIAQAGRKGAITIATNMAGRGTDIILGGNVEILAKKQMRKERFVELSMAPDSPDDIAQCVIDEVIAESSCHEKTENKFIIAARERFNELKVSLEEAFKKESREVCGAGGLYIIGTERHEARRIDNQLRGRAGRQSDPGASHFFLSLEDDLLRLFGGERSQTLMNSMGVNDNDPIESRILTGTIENAQKRLEGKNFEMRKNVLRYDDVINSQRTTVYAERQKVISGEDITESIDDMVKSNVESACALHLFQNNPQLWDLAALRNYYQNWLIDEANFLYSDDELRAMSRQEIVDVLYDLAKEKIQDKEDRCPTGMFPTLTRNLLLQKVDRAWVEHIDNMDQLRRGIGLRGFAQKDPVVEYRMEGHEMYEEMIATLRKDFVKTLVGGILRINTVVKPAPISTEQVTPVESKTTAPVEPSEPTPTES